MNRQLKCIDQSLPVGSLNSYIYWVNQIPMLTAEEEIDFANKLIKNNDLESARKLVLSHLRLVVRIARNYDGYGLPQADLIQEGNIGLMKAVKRFNPEMGVRLVSFAVHWIRAEIHEFILKNWRIVKIATTKAQRKLFFNLRKLSKNRSWLSNAEVETVANELSVSTKDVRQMEERLNNYDEAFEGSDNEDEFSSYRAPEHYLEDYHYSPGYLLEQHNWEDKRQDSLHQALEKLDQRSRDIIHQRWLKEEKATLHDLAAQYNVSAERIRQLEKNAINKVREAIEIAN
ncbi:MAG: RNA polymerase sigma factor RpoH [Proteobacteria bacterium]|nr:RNA polymerase sigma factor RpoH [Pseudomonadota bacterium]